MGRKHNGITPVRVSENKILHKWPFGHSYNKIYYLDRHNQKYETWPLSYSTQQLI